MAGSAIVVADLAVRRGGVPVLTGLDLEVRAGEVTGLLGPSGCGKTTLLRAIVGTQVVAGGSVAVLGHPAGSARLRHRVGYVTQAPSVYADLMVRENLRFFARVLGLRRARAAVRTEEVIAEVALEGQAGRLVRTLSGGQRSRVSLAAALLADPDVLILDEPTVGLDPVVRRDIWAAFAARAAAGATVLVSSHVMDEAHRCDRLLLMRAGAIVVDDTPDGVCARTGAPDVEAAFLALVEGS